MKAKEQAYRLPSYFYRGNSVSAGDVHAALKEIGGDERSLQGDDLADRFNTHLGHLQTIVYTGNGEFTVA